MQHASLQCDDEQWKYQVQFGKERPTFSPLNDHRSTIISRGLSTVPLDPNPPPPQLSYTLITASSPGCLSSDPACAASAPMLEYRQGNEEWKTVNYRKEVTEV